MPIREVQCVRKAFLAGDDQIACNFGYILLIGARC